MSVKVFNKWKVVRFTFSFKWSYIIALVNNQKNKIKGYAKLQNNSKTIEHNKTVFKSVGEKLCINSVVFVSK